METMKTTKTMINGLIVELLEDPLQEPEGNFVLGYAYPEGRAFCFDLMYLSSIRRVHVSLYRPSRSGIGVYPVGFLVDWTEDQKAAKPWLELIAMGAALSSGFQAKGLPGMPSHEPLQA